MAVRNMILEIHPALEETIAWNAPVYKFNGKYVAGLCAFKNHLTFSPQSPEFMVALANDLEGFITSKSSFQFDVDKPIPKEFLTKLIKARLTQIS
jgi:uncharacterized protein